MREDESFGCGIVTSAAGIALIWPRHALVPPRGGRRRLRELLLLALACTGPLWGHAAI
jgi:hypothetical protein